MGSHRIERVNDLVRQVTSDLIRDLKDPRLGDELVSITEAHVTGDLRHAKLYVSAMAAPERQAEIVDALNHASAWLRRALKHQVRLRRIPDLQFHLDPSIEHGARILEVLRQTAADTPSPEAERPASSE